jgi:N-acetylneuraminate synthase
VTATVEIAGRPVGEGHPVFIVAEMGANHDRDLEQALALVGLAADAGVDAVKLQTYTADTLAMPTTHPSARVDPVWGAATLHELYERASMPYEFHEPLFARARQRGLAAFSSVFDEPGVDFLERLDVPAYKIASPELVHLPLLQRVGRTRKPVLLSTGMSDLRDVEEALGVLDNAGACAIVLLHCCSAYPADPAAMNLAAMETMRRAFGYPVGLSDHTTGLAIPIAAAALGACLIEKHFTNDPRRPGPDHRFSMPASELPVLVDGIRSASLARGDGLKHATHDEYANRATARRSIFAAVPIRAGSIISADMLRVVRPGSGLHPRYLELVIGRVARRDVAAGWPLTWDDV